MNSYCNIFLFSKHDMVPVVLPELVGDVTLDVGEVTNVHLILYELGVKEVLSTFIKRVALKMEKTSSTYGNVLLA